MEMSPVMDMAVWLDARQAPASCALTETQQPITDPKMAHTNFSRVIS
jgi:hypothetical protein